MLQDLLKKLESEHGINPSQGQGILNTIAQHLKGSFPMIGGMLDNVLGSNAASATNAGNSSHIEKSHSGLQQLEEMAKGKLGGLFGK